MHDVMLKHKVSCLKCPKALSETLKTSVACAGGAQVSADAAARKHLLFAHFAEELQVLAHGVRAVHRRVQTLGFISEHRQQLGRV